MCVACKLTKVLYICLHTLVNSVIDMCTVYSVHVNLYCIVYTTRSLPPVFDSVLYVYTVHKNGS